MASSTSQSPAQWLEAAEQEAVVVPAEVEVAVAQVAAQVLPLRVAPRLFPAVLLLGERALQAVDVAVRVVVAAVAAVQPRLGLNRLRRVCWC